MFLVGTRRFELPTFGKDKQKEFFDYCLVNLQLAESSSKRYCREIERFLAFAQTRKDSVNIVIREYLREHNQGNALRALKAYFSFLGQKEILGDFRFPTKTYRIRTVTTEQLQHFFHALKASKEKALFLMYATTGIRRNELLTLTMKDVDQKTRMVKPNNHGKSQTKHSWVSFYDEEAEYWLNEYLKTRNDSGSKLFPHRKDDFCRMWREAREKTGIHLSPQDLRFWFCCEMGRLGVPDRYIDAFCGRVPQKIIARHYTDYSPERLKEIYDKAGLKVLS